MRFFIFAVLLMLFSGCALHQSIKATAKTKPAVEILMRPLSTPAAPRSVGLQWNANPEPNITGYRIWYGFVHGVYPRKYGVLLTSTFARVPAFNFSVYYVVRAYNSDGMESAESSEVHYP